MSEFSFMLPDLGEGTVEAEIAEWMVKVGDQVNEEDPVCAMLTDKAAVEIPSLASKTAGSICQSISTFLQPSSAAATVSARVPFASNS